MTIYLLSTYGCWFICETPSVLAHSVMLYYILQTLLLSNRGSGDETKRNVNFMTFATHACKNQKPTQCKYYYAIPIVLNLHLRKRYRWRLDLKDVTVREGKD